MGQSHYIGHGECSLWPLLFRLHV